MDRVNVYVCLYCQCVCVCVREEYCNISLRIRDCGRVAHYMCCMQVRLSQGEGDVSSCKGNSSHISYREITCTQSFSHLLYMQ